MDGSREHYAKWNKPVRERQIPYDFTHVLFKEQTELTSKIEADSQIESRMTAKVGGGQQVEGLSKKEKDS